MRPLVLVFKFLLFAGCATSASAADPMAWLRQPPGSAFPKLWSLPEVPSSSVYEVKATKVRVAETQHLEEQAFAQITCEDAQYFVSGRFVCEAGKQPYVVRSVYRNGGTGGYVAHFDGENLYVYHGSLGHPEPLRTLPLVINLASPPKRVYAWTGGGL